MKADINTFAKKINIKVKNIALLKNALTHKSADKKSNNDFIYCSYQYG